jgi:hypothetical protein
MMIRRVGGDPPSYLPPTRKPKVLGSALSQEKWMNKDQPRLLAFPPADLPFPPLEPAMAPEGAMRDYYPMSVVVLSVGAVLCLRDLVLWARVYTSVNSVLKGAVWITLGGTILAGVQMAVAVEGLCHGRLQDKGERENVTLAVDSPARLAHMLERISLPPWQSRVTQSTLAVLVSCRRWGVGCCGGVCDDGGGVLA